MLPDLRLLLPRLSASAGDPEAGMKERREKLERARRSRMDSPSPSGRRVVSFVVQST